MTWRRIHASSDPDSLIFSNVDVEGSKLSVMSSSDVDAEWYVSHICSRGIFLLINLTCPGW